MTAKAYSYIRFSTPEQARGDSLRRQLEATQTYCQEHGLLLDENLQLQDLGKSAYRGANVSEGTLGEFLRAVETGAVEPGSTLIVESLDRLSRDRVQSALRQLLDLLANGVSVVTLSDRRVFNRDSETLDLMASLMVMERANEESRLKGKRVGAAWAAKRKQAVENGHKMTAKCPAWLALDRERAAYLAIPERVEVIRRIFAMNLDGIGQAKIAATFNEERLPTWGRGEGWRESYIAKVLNNEAVIGRYQPHRRVFDQERGKSVRVPEGAAIDGYFPAVVSEDDFLRAQEMRVGRRIATGPKGKAFSNLFTGIATCGRCGGSMVFDNKGNGDAYLVCSNAKRRAGDCKRLSWRYPVTEALILLGLEGVDFRDLFPATYSASREALDRLEAQRLKAQATLVRAGKDAEKVVALLIERGSSPSLTEKLDALDAAKRRLPEEIAELEREIAQEQVRMKGAASVLEEAEAALAQWVEVLQAGDGAEIYALRAKMHQLFKRTIQNIVLEPGTGSLHGRIVIKVRDSERPILIEVEKGMEVAQCEGTVLFPKDYPARGMGRIVGLGYVRRQMPIGQS